MGVPTRRQYPQTMIHNARMSDSSIISSYSSIVLRTEYELLLYVGHEIYQGL